LAELLVGADEVRALRTHYPVPRRGLPTGDKALAAKAHGRACVVLLSSHLDQYLYAVNEEAVAWLNGQACHLDKFPAEFLLQHTRRPVDALAHQSWEKRGKALSNFIASQGPLWSPGGLTGSLDADELVTWLKSPEPESLVRFFKLYGIDDISRAVTRKPSTRGVLHLGIRELVEKRNNIAHGDFQTQATPTDVTRYLFAVGKFAESADKVLARAIRKMAKASSTPW
jgi:hypothetical protein